MTAAMSLLLLSVRRILPLVAFGGLLGAQPSPGPRVVPLAGRWRCFRLDPNHQRIWAVDGAGARAPGAGRGVPGPNGTEAAFIKLAGLTLDETGGSLCVLDAIGFPEVRICVVSGTQLGLLRVDWAGKQRVE
jgi:hypothetical protein